MKPDAPSEDQPSGPVPALGACAATPFGRRQFLAASLGGAATLMLAACGGGTAGQGGVGGATTKPVGSSSPGTVAAGAPASGGNLRIAFVGGGNAETLNPTIASLADIDICRSYQLFDGLVSKLTLDGKIQMALAESLEPNTDGTLWTIKLRKGVTWHDGSPFGADDVIYWLNFLNDPKNGCDNNFMCQLFFDVKNIKKVDAATVQLPMTLPVADLASLLAFESYGVIKNGTKDFSHPIGTGPFKFTSWTQGQQSVFSANTDYWGGAPHIDTLQLTSIPDDTARLNALLADQIDGAATLPYAQAKAYQGKGASSPIAILVSNGSSQTYFTLGMSHPPFNDPRVVEAFKLIIDRNQMLSQVNVGFGEILNDLWGKGLDYYDTGIAQREQDIDKAKSLLKQAGHEGLTTTITTSSEKSGQIQAATLLAQQAKAAGVTINLHQVPADTYYSTGWPNYPFGQTSYETAPIPYFYAAALLPGGPFNDIQWTDPAVATQLKDALGEMDPGKSKDKWNAMQQTIWDKSGWICWGSSPWVDGLSKKVQGTTPIRWQLASFGGYDFSNYWLS